MNKIIKALIFPMIMTFGMNVSASIWKCEVEESFGNSQSVDAVMYLSLDRHSIQFEIRDMPIKVSPLTKSQGLYDYSKQESSDLGNERITSAIMLRFNSLDGHLVYLNHEANHQLIVGTCIMQGSSS